MGPGWGPVTLLESFMAVKQNAPKLNGLKNNHHFIYSRSEE